MRKKGFHAVFALLIPSADIGCATTIAASRPISEQTASELSDAIEGHYARVTLTGNRRGRAARAQGRQGRSRDDGVARVTIERKRMDSHERTHGLGAPDRDRRWRGAIERRYAFWSGGGSVPHSSLTATPAPAASGSSIVRALGRGETTEDLARIASARGWPSRGTRRACRCATSRPKVGRGRGDRAARRARGSKAAM